MEKKMVVTAHFSTFHFLDGCASSALWPTRLADSLFQRMEQEHFYLHSLTMKKTDLISRLYLSIREFFKIARTLTDLNFILIKYLHPYLNHDWYSCPIFSYEIEVEFILKTLIVISCCPNAQIQYLQPSLIKVILCPLGIHKMFKLNHCFRF